MITEILFLTEICSPFGEFISARIQVSVIMVIVLPYGPDYRGFVMQRSGTAARQDGSAGPVHC
jgi:hypothetical protein